MRTIGPTVLVLLAMMSGAAAAGEQSKVPAVPVLVNTCLITARFGEMVEFYRTVLGIEAKNKTEGVYAEFATGGGTLAIFSAEAQEKYISGSAEAGKNRSSILEFKVTDVDGEYARLQKTVKMWVKAPSDQPWGTRSIYFRDPDGNLVDFYMWVKK
jgi:uncharacterized glyoxalase superfamily protein PhnB